MTGSDGPLFIGIDCGTGALKAGVFDCSGAVLAQSQREYSTVFARPGWAEQDPADWWRAAVESIRECVGRLPLGEAARISGIGLGATGASTVVTCDLDGTPTGPALLWMDTRAVAEAAEIDSTGHPVLRYAGGSVSPEWLIPKAMWLKRNHPRRYRDSARVVEATDWLTYMLTGRWTASMCLVTDAWNYVPALGGWDEALLKGLGMSDLLSRWPETIQSMGEVAGFLRRGAADELGIPAGLPVAVGGIDSHVAMLGMGVVAPGSLAFITGSSNVYLTLTEEAKFVRGLWGPYQDAVIRGLWLLEGGQVSTGSILSWFVRNFARDVSPAGSPYAGLDRMAAQIPPGSEGLILLDYWQGNRTPLRDGKARGAVWGLSLKHGPAHVFRAIMEGVAMGARHVLETLDAGGVPVRDVLVCGGNAKSDVWLRIYADVCKVPLTVTAFPEATMLGAAVCAAAASGAYASLGDAAAHMARRGRSIQPDPRAGECYDALYQDYLETYQRLRDLMHRSVDRIDHAGGPSGDRGV